MLIIHENPGLKQQEVGQTLSIQQPNLVALVNELVWPKASSERTVNAVDRRSYSLSLTTAGRSRLTQASRAHAENERRLVEAVAPVPADAFRAALLRIRRDYPPTARCVATPTPDLASGCVLTLQLDMST